MGAPPAGRRAGGGTAPAPIPQIPDPNIDPKTFRRRKRLLGGTLLIVVVLVIINWVDDQRGSGDDAASRPRPEGTPRPTLDAPRQAANVRWQRAPGDFRHDLESPRFVNSISGDFDAGHVAMIGDIWLVITGNENATDTELTALDPADGSELWRRSLDGVLCATEAPESGVLCASALEREPQTGLGTRWRLHRLDPRTGSDRVHADIDAWATAVHYTGGTFVVLEQRRPAPHAVVRAYAADDLSELWVRDLKRERGHAEMFSGNRIIGRPEPKQLGDAALDRPRFRDLGKTAVAVWAGQRTAFLDRRTGKLIMMPRCTRPVDDGRRLWCNAGGDSVARSYSGEELYQTTGVRLTYAKGDAGGRDITRPVFYDPDGAIHSVDPKSGETLGKISDLGMSPTFSGTLDPGSVHAGGHTFVSGEGGTVLLDDEKDAVVWHNDALHVRDVPIIIGDRAYVDYRSMLARIDLRTGEADRIIADLPGVNNVVDGDAVASWSSDVIAAINLG